jgi:hypothetical protein
MPDNDKIWDSEHLRGLTDIVKNKTLFFIPFFQRLSGVPSHENGLHQRRQFRYLASHWIGSARQCQVHIGRLKSSVGDRELPDDFHLSQNGHRTLGE